MSSKAVDVAELDRLIGQLCLEYPSGSKALMEHGVPALERILQVVCGEEKIALPPECGGRSYADNVPGMIAVLGEKHVDELIEAVQKNGRLRKPLVVWALGLVNDQRVTELLKQAKRSRRKTDE